MEKLTKEADGYYRTPSGFCGVMPRLAAGVTSEGLSWFEFRTDAFSDIIRVEWPQGAPVALFESSISGAMIRNNYGRNLTDAVMEEFNRLVDASGEGSGEPIKPVQQAAPPLAPETPQTPVPLPGEPGFPPDGWLPHPEAPGYFYKGQEVLTEAVLRERSAAPDAPDI